ncbi:unnamed protein product [Caenorhabditis auriculariae]|uniref:Uncharacterized protein n=1 Tax=Caenorhabditis auriculariae TaxID=2777116 RepID=A0A8S1HEX9_9PELO|nr:unnamed protein product [Caenorhabditis auriculariae]
MVSPSHSDLQPPYFTDGEQAWDAPPTPKLRRVSVNREYSLLTKCFAEFIGDLTFVFIGCMQAVQIGDGPTHAALAHGFTIFILVTAFGHISGGHFNPAVSWAIAGAGKMPIWHLPFYVASQLFGGFCGAMLVAAVLTPSQYDASDGGATLLATDTFWWKGLIAEALATFFLVHTILISAADSNSVILAPLAIGLTLSIDIYAVGEISSASMNPARSLGPNIAGSIFLSKLPPNFWNFHYIYWAGPLAGSTAALCLYKVFEAREDRFVQ